MTERSILNKRSTYRSFFFSFLFLLLVYSCFLFSFFFSSFLPARCSVSLCPFFLFFSRWSVPFPFFFCCWFVLVFFSFYFFQFQHFSLSFLLMSCCSAKKLSFTVTRLVLNPCGTRLAQAPNHIMLYCHLQHHNDTIVKTQEDFFINICTSHFIVRVQKCYSKFECERELETDRNCNILTPTLMAVNVVSFSFSRAAQPEAQGLNSLLRDGFLYCILSATYLQLVCSPNSIGVPEGPFGRVWLSLPHLVYNSDSNSNWNCLNFCLD